MKCSTRQAKSLNFTIWNIAGFPCTVTPPTPKKRWTRYKLSRYLECKWTLKTILTLQPKVCLGFLLMFIVKQALASQKPVTKWGLRLFVLVVYFVLFINNKKKNICLSMNKFGGLHIYVL